MEHSSHRTKQDQALLREIYRTYLDQFAAMAAYTYRAVMLRPISVTVSVFLAEMAEQKMHAFVALGELLRDNDYSPTIDLRLRQTPINLQGKSPAQAAMLTQQILLECAAEEKHTAETYRRQAAWTRDNGMQKTLLSLADDTSRHADALAALQRRAKGS